MTKMVVANKINLKASTHKMDFKENTQPHKWVIYWPNCIALSILHIAAVYGFFLRADALPLTDFFMKIIGFLAAIGITSGMHRLWCHRAYKATPFAQIIIMFMASLTYQNSVYTWCKDHRLHHKYSETDADPHNARRGFFFSHVGWLLVKKHPSLKSKRNTIDLSDLEANPIVMFQHKYYYPIVFICTFFISTFVPWYFWGESLVITFFRTTIYRYIVGVNLTWTINSFAHLVGNKPYDRNIGPAESQVIKFMTVGESFHNYHHAFPWDYKASEYSNDSKNMTTIFIDCLAWFGLVYDRKIVSSEGVENRCRRTGDGTYNDNKTVFHKYFPKNVDLFFKNAYNLTMVLLFIYIL